MDLTDSDILPLGRSEMAKGGPEVISHSTFLDKVTELLKISHSRELPGMFNPRIIGDLFHE